jgi:Flp pilus assembly protein TadB
VSTNKDPEETIRQLESRLQKLEKERKWDLDERAEQKGKEEQGRDAQLLGFVIGAPIALILSIATSLPIWFIIFMAILTLYIWIVAAFRLGR